MYGRTRPKAKTTRGTTIIELLVVLVIIGVLAGIVLLRGMWRNKERAEQARLRVEARDLSSAQEMYRIETGGFYTGAFDPASVRAAGFMYFPPPDVRLFVEHADPARWSGLLAMQDEAAAAKAPDTYCRLSLSGDGNETTCAIQGSRVTEGPDDGDGVSSPEHPPTAP